MVRVGIMVEGQEGLTWDRWRRMAEAVDQLGFESLWRSDHLFSLYGVPTRPGLDLWPSLTAAALWTRRVRFGPLVSPVTVRHPSLLAREAAAVDVLSGGRLELGVGAGWHQGEHEAFGIPFPSAAERIRRLDEAVHVLRALWADAPASFEGRYYRLREAVGWPKPAQRTGIPLIIGGRGPRVLQVVARHADEWNLASSRPVAEVRRLTAELEAACRRVGRDPRTIRRSWMGGVLVGETGRELEHRAQRIQEYVPPRAAVSTGRLPGVLRQDGWLVGTPVDIVGQIRELAGEGIHRVMLQVYDQEDHGLLHCLADRVLPSLA